MANWSLFASYFPPGGSSLDVLTALGADDVLAAREEAATDEGHAALVAAEAIAVPVALVKRDEFGASQSSDGFGAPAALLGKEFSETVGAVGTFFARGELLAGQDAAAVGAGEAVAVEGCALVGDATLVNHSVALSTTLGELLLVAGHADELVVTWDEPLVSDWLPAGEADEALLVPLLAAELVLLHARLEHVAAAIAAGGEVVVVAVGAVELLILGGERLVHQGLLAVHALEAFLVPVLVLVGQILGVSSDGGLALLTRVGEQALVTLDAEGMLVSQDVAVSCQGQVAVPAAKVAAMPVLVHGFRVFPRKDKRLSL